MAKKFEKNTSIVLSAEKNKKTFYGYELVLELFDCDLKRLTSKKYIQEFVDGMCKTIDMEKHGPLHAERYMGGGIWGKGFSFLQFITTSSITGHFIETDKTAFINVFSCNAFDAKKADEFAKKFFRAKRFSNHLIIH
ncbi:MAG: S-adenosylmethionine decarboxylase [Patescibacteria group bacterium]